MTARLTELPRYVYGTTRLGDAAVPQAERVEFARAVLDAGLWIHTSDQYGDALDVLGAAIVGRADAPSAIVKLGGGTAVDVAATASRCAARLGVETIAVGQLSPVDGLDDALRAGGSALDGLRRLREEGLVGRFVLEIFPWTSDAPLDAVRAGHLDALVDGFIMYINPLQRFASNALWRGLHERDELLISMRTVAGNDVHALRDVPGAAWRPYLRDRAVEVAPIFDRSGVATWGEFCVRFALGVPGVSTTVGSTLRQDHLDAFLEHSSALPGQPLAPDVMDELSALQRRWSDELDIHAEPWSM